MNGVLYGVGVGPGDPELITLKSLRLIKSTEVIAYPKLKGSKSFARNIIEEFIDLPKVEIAIEIPMTVNRLPAQRAYNAAAQEISTHLNMGKNVVFLCEGDPFFYGSFMHIYERLRFEIPIEVVPAITGMSAAWTATGLPITWGDNILTILTGTLSEKELVDKISTTDAAVIMKVGQNLNKIRAAITLAERENDAFIVEFAAMLNQSVCKLVEYTKEVAPYFSIIILHGKAK